MNDYNGNRDNMNNNYDQSCVRESGTEGSCRYTPKDCCANKAGGVMGRYILLGAVSMLLLMMVILPGIMLGSLIIRNAVKKPQGAPLSVGNSYGDPTMSDHGISAVDVTSKNLFYYHRYGITSKGVIVTDSEYTDELEFGDRIISVNGVDIQVSDDIERAVSGCAAGDVVSITVERGGKRITVDLTLHKEAPDYVDFG